MNEYWTGSIVYLYLTASFWFIISFYLFIYELMSFIYELMSFIYQSFDVDNRALNKPFLSFMGAGEPNSCEQ